MKNKAKCKLCQSVIESYCQGDYVMCKCGEIAVTDGDALHCAAKDWNNFLRVDDEGNEIIPTVKDSDVKQLDKPSKKELLEMLDNMIESIENLPPHAMHVAATNYDLLSALLLIGSIFRSEDT